MKKFQPDNNILRLDTKIKPFIPNFIPSIGEVDAFIKLNRPDNKIEELGLDLIDEPTYNGIDPSVFSLELSYKLKSHIPENFIIKNIENADKNPKQIQNWINNMENLRKEVTSNFVSYSKKMPEIEDLMQVK
jgi:intraflagellar transport protein 46